MENITFRSSLNPVFVLLFAGLLIISIGILVGINNNRKFGVVLLLLLIIALFLRTLSTKYVFTREGLLIKAPLGSGPEKTYPKDPVRYESITHFYETKDQTQSTLATYAVCIIYHRKDGSKDSFVITPANRDRFIMELRTRTGKPLSVMNDTYTEPFSL